MKYWNRDYSNFGMSRCVCVCVCVCVGGRGGGGMDALWFKVRREGKREYQDLLVRM